MVKLVVVGLGNPGRAYGKTRHNVGFMFVDLLSKRWGARDWRKGRFSLYTFVESKGVFLVKPMTYMNRSGDSVAIWAKKEGLNKLLVVYDDFDIPLGRAKLLPKGGPGTHNGMKSIIEKLGTGSFMRLRVGIGPKPPDLDPAGFVLSRFSLWEMKVVSEVLGVCADGIELLLAEGASKAMSFINSFRADIPHKFGLKDLLKKVLGK